MHSGVQRKTLVHNSWDAKVNVVINIHIHLPSVTYKDGNVEPGRESRVFEVETGNLSSLK